NSSSLYYLTTTDLVNFSDPIKVIAPSPIQSAFDNTGIYRSSIVKIKNTYFLFYSALDHNGVRSMALSYGSDMRSLRGFGGSGSIDLTNLSNATFKKNDMGVTIDQNESITNTLDVKQTSTIGKYGGIK